MLFSIVWVLVTTVLLWRLLDPAHTPTYKIGRMDFVLIECVLVASFCFIVIAKLMRKYRKKSVSLFLDHFSSLCVSVATIILCLGALICVGIQLYQGLTYHHRVQKIETLYSHINDLYYGMLTTNSDIMYADSTKGHLAYERLLRGLDKALKVKDTDRSYYKSALSRLPKYLEGVQVSAFADCTPEKTIEQINEYQSYINYLFAKIEKAERSEELRDQIDSVKIEFNKKIDSLKISVNTQDTGDSLNPQH